MDMTAERHQALSGNLANVHTPGYRRMDISESFLDKLNEAIRSRDVASIDSVGQPVFEASNTKDWPSRSADGNNVNLEKEMTLMAQNQLTFEANAQFLSGSLKRLESAITGRVS